MAKTDSNELFNVAGLVTNEVGVGLAGLRIEAWDHGLRGETRLGKGTTDARGGYSIRYSREQLNGKERADLEIRVLDPNDRKAVLAHSPVAYQAAPDSAVDIVVGRRRGRRGSEFERLLETCDRLLGEGTLKELELEGVPYVAGRTGWDPRAVAMAALAVQYGSSTVPAEHFYALFRSGFDGTTLWQVYLAPKAELTWALENAIEQRVIPGHGSIPATVAAIAKAAPFVLVKMRAPGAVSTLAEMLALRLEGNAVLSFLNAYHATLGDQTKLWSKLAEAGFEEETIAGLRCDAALGKVTLQNAPLVRRLTNEEGIASLEDLAAAGFHNPARWMETIEDVPDEMTAEDYAAGMAAQVNLAVPMPVAADIVRRKELRLGADREVASFLDDAHGEHTLGVEPVSSWEGFDRLGEKAREGVLRLERLYQVTPSNDSMVTLARLGLDSAARIASHPREAFMEKYGGAFTNESEAALVHRKAAEVHATALNLATTYLATRANPNVYALTGETEKAPVAENNASGVVVAATLEELFQNMDYCACEECSSVFSPAAYFVELLELLDLSDVPHTGDNPIDVLLSRRPDLQHILLSCENTNVVLPHIDIVNEVLEHYVVNGSLTGYTGHNVEASAKTADLLADPQFVENAAYKRTAEEVYPWSLPFEMPLAAMRLLFRLWDTALADALEIFGDPAAARRERLGCGEGEYRALTDTGFHSLPEYFGEPAGTSIGDLNAAVANAKTFCRRADISYEDLVAILATRFVNPSVALVPTLELLRTPIEALREWFEGGLTDDELRALLPANLDLAPFGGDPLAWLTANRETIARLIVLTDLSPESVECDFAQLELRFALGAGGGERLMEIEFIRLHRFVRLWRKLGWTIAQTDSLLAAFLDTPAAQLTTANVDAAFTSLLDRAANFLRLRETLDIPAGDISDWLSLWDADVAADERRDHLARLLGVGTGDHAHLIEIAGIDPLADDMDGDEPSLLRFARILRAIRSSPLKVADLDYLLRHRDGTGKLTPSEAEQLRDVKALRDALTAVESDLGTAVANPDLAGAKSKMALVYDPAVADRLFALVSHTTTYSTPFSSPEETLPAPLAGASPRLDLDPFAEQLTYAGTMTEATQTALEAKAAGLDLEDVDEISSQAELDAFIEELKQAIGELRELGDTDLASLTSEYPELAPPIAAAEAQAEPAEKAKAILGAILPELRAGLKAQALRTALAAIAKADAPVIDAITAGAAVMHAESAATEGVLEDFLMLERAPKLSDGTHELLIDPIADGKHILYVEAPVESKVRLTIDGEEKIPATVVGDSGEVATSKPVELKLGTLHRLDLELVGLPGSATAHLRWRTNAVAKDEVPASRLYRLTAVDEARDSLLRIRKAVMLQRSLGLTAGELRHLATTEPATRGFLDALDTDGSIGEAPLHAQWARVELLLWFAQLKADHENEPDTLLSLLEDPESTTPQGGLLAAGIMEWDEPSLKAVLKHRGIEVAALAKLEELHAVTRMMDFVTPTLQPAAELIEWAVPDPDPSLPRSAKEAVRARMTEATWRESVQDVNDTLRNQRRDALVAYILFHDPPAPAIVTPDRLYEHFLLDVQMDSCRQTSRIRQAIATVQMFVNRCLMNLEEDVSPDSINVEHWQWMQRYRVWEANRRVFVRPENWLEPELRDGKSPFFRELEAELLKSDITDELAETAYLSYLKKLDDVARLEIVASYLHQGESGEPNDDVLHVFGRTNGTTREYYSRRFEAGSWTPWEKMPLKIEGDLLIPIVWKRQLFVFWVTPLPKGKSGDRDKTPQELGSEEWGGNTTTTAELVLSWGEFYKGKWTSPKSSEMKDPLRIENLTAFRPEHLVVTARAEKPAMGGPPSERLILSVLYLDQGAAAFTVTFTSKQAPPLVEKEAWAKVLDEPKIYNFLLFWTGQTQLDLDSNSMRYFDRTFEVGVMQPDFKSIDKELLLTKQANLLKLFRINPIMSPVENQWEAPFFYSDEFSVFSVQGDERLWDDFWFIRYYDPGPPIYILRPARIPLLYERPVIPEIGDPVIRPWVGIVSPTYEVVILDHRPFTVKDTAFMPIDLPRDEIGEIVERVKR